MVSQAARHQTGRQGHQKIAEVVRELHPGGLRLGEVQVVLKVFADDIDHAVAKAPQEKK